MCVYERIFTEGVLSAPVPELYTSIISYHFRTSSTKPLRQSKFYIGPPEGRGTRTYINGPGRMTKMAATPINGKIYINTNNLLQNK